MVKHKIEYALTLFIMRLARTLTEAGAHKLGDFFGDLFYYLIPIRKKVMVENLHIAFGTSKSNKEIATICRRCYRHFGRMLMEFARMSKLKRDHIPESIPVQNAQLIHEQMKKNKGLLILSAHFGNWEFLAAALANLGYPLYCVFMQQKNVQVDELIKKNRTDVGLLPLKIGGGAAKGVFSALRSKAIVFIVMDQDAGKDGAFLDFFGKPAATTTGPANLALRYKIPVVMAFGTRRRDGRIAAQIIEFPPIEQFGNDEQGLQQFLTLYLRNIETIVRRHPEQYFWMHRRWKTPPSVATES